MPRPLRYNVPGTVYHLISRFVDREWFISDELERTYYLQLLRRAIRESDWRCLAFAVMSNHIHLGMIAGEQRLASWLGPVHSQFADQMNKDHDRIGTMFVRGPKDYAVRPENVGKLIAYIHNNPVRAGVVEYARQSDWTSHKAYLCPSRSPDWLDVDEGLALSGFSDPAEFDRWVSVEPGDPSRTQLEAVRRAARKRGTIEVGTPTGGDEPVVPLFVRPWARIRPDPRDVVRIVAEEVGIPEAELCSRRRTAVVAAGRRVSVYCGISLGLTGTDMAAALGISQQAASRTLRSELAAEELAGAERVLRRMAPETLSFAPAPVG